MNAKRTLLQIPKPTPVRGDKGRYELAKGDRLLEAHRMQKAKDAEPKKG